MAVTKKTWREKVDKIEERIHTITPEYESRYGKGKILIPSARDIENLIKRSKKGELLTQDTIRDSLAELKKVQATDPMTTGIFLRIIAEAAEEERVTKKEVTPYWRVLKPDGSINTKYPGGVEAQIDYLKSEGHTIEPAKGKKPPRVVEFEKRIPADN